MKNRLLRRLYDRYVNWTLPYLRISEVPVYISHSALPSTLIECCSPAYVHADVTDLLPEDSPTQCTHVVCTQPLWPLRNTMINCCFGSSFFASQTE